MVIDYRKLNEKTILDAYPLPNIDEILDQLGNARYFSAFDLASGFHQIGMSSKDVAKTAFSTPNGHFEYVRARANAIRIKKRTANLPADDE